MGREWMEAAACLGHPLGPEAWTGEKNGLRASAIEVCRNSCSAREACLAYQMQFRPRDRWHVYGGRAFNGPGTEHNAVRRRAAELLGVTVKEFRAAFGNGNRVAERVVAELGVEEL